METLNEKQNFPDLGYYKIIAQLGIGGFGKVYRATNSKNHKDVIIKVIESNHIWSKLIAKRKRILSCHLNHTPKIFDVVTINGHNCIVEEFIDGESLDKIISTNTLKFCDFFTIIKDIIGALQTLYAHDLVHGDIKPSNIIIKKDFTEAFLIDIDSAFLHERGASKFFGTLVFAAPEQILENSLSTYSDIYSLGILMFNLLENRTPFNMNKEGILDKVNGDVVFTLSSVTEVSFKERLQTLVVNMTQNERKHRLRIADVLKEIDILQTIAEKNNELNHTLRKEEPAIYLSNENSDKETNNHTFLVSVAFTTGMLIPRFPHTTNIENDDDIYNSTINPVLQIKHLNTNKSAANSRTHESYYRKQLIKEYAQINKQAMISFWLWVSTFIVGFAIIAISVVMTVLGNFIEALITVILESLVYFVQRLFAIREDYYRKLNSDKLKHLESGDYYDYIMSILDTTSEDYREKRIDTIITSIQKQIETNTNT